MGHTAYFSASNYIAPGGGGYPLFFAYATRENITNSGIESCLYSTNTGRRELMHLPWYSSAHTSLTSSVRVVKRASSSDGAACESARRCDRTREASAEALKVRWQPA